MISLRLLNVELEQNLCFDVLVSLSGTVIQYFPFCSTIHMPWWHLLKFTLSPSCLISCKKWQCCVIFLPPWEFYIDLCAQFNAKFQTFVKTTNHSNVCLRSVVVSTHKLSYKGHVLVQVNFIVFRILWPIPANYSEKISGVFLPMQLHPIFTPLHWPEFCFIFGTVYSRWKVKRIEPVRAWTDPPCCAEACCWWCPRSP
jgi:hypothetical protein